MKLTKQQDLEDALLSARLDLAIKLRKEGFRHAKPTDKECWELAGDYLASLISTAECYVIDGCVCDKGFEERFLEVTGRTYFSEPDDD